MRRLWLLALVATAGCSDLTGSGSDLERIVVSIVGSDSATVLLNDTVRAQALPQNDAGQAVHVPAIRWTSDNPAVATVDSAGLVAGLSRGSTTITATAEGVSGSVLVTVAGTLHQQHIRATETWSAVGSPHVVRGWLEVGGVPRVTLTIEAGAELIMEDSAGFDFGVGGEGVLLADGTDDEISISGVRDGPGVWGNLRFRDAGLSRLSNVVIRDCGSEVTRPFFGCLHAFDLGTDSVPTLSLEDVTIRSAAVAAIEMEGRSRFEPGSRNLSVADIRGRVGTLSPAAALDFPAGGSFDGVDVPEIRLEQGTVNRSGTWPALDVAWELSGFVWVEGDPSPRLTIEAGARIRIEVGGLLSVGERLPGSLELGTTGGPLVEIQCPDIEGPGGGGVVLYPRAGLSAIRDAEFRNCSAVVGFGIGALQVVGDASHDPFSAPRERSLR